MYKSSKISTAKTERLNFVSQSRFSRDCDTVLNYGDDDEIKTFHNIFVNISESIMNRQINSHSYILKCKKHIQKKSGAVFIFFSKCVK